MAKKKKRPSGPKGHQLAAIEGILSQCRPSRKFKAADIKSWLKAIKQSHITNHLKTLADKGEVKRLGKGIYVVSGEKSDKGE